MSPVARPVAGSGTESAATGKQARGLLLDRPMFPRIAVLLLTVASAVHLLACASCPYEQRCNGNTLETCDLGVDQMFGDPSYFSQECEAPNAACVETGSRTARCVMSAESTCHSDRCSADGLAVNCSDGYEVATVCETDGNECVIVAQRARCALVPAVECVRESYDNSCEDDTHLLICVDGFVMRKDCWTDGRAPCEPHTPKDEYEQTAYCGASSEGDAGADGN